MTAEQMDALLAYALGPGGLRGCARVVPGEPGHGPGHHRVHASMPTRVAKSVAGGWARRGPSRRVPTPPRTQALPGPRRPPRRTSGSRSRTGRHQDVAAVPADRVPCVPVACHGPDRRTAIAWPWPDLTSADFQPLRRPAEGVLDRQLDPGAGRPGHDRAVGWRPVHRSIQMPDGTPADPDAPAAAARRIGGPPARRCPRDRSRRWTSRSVRRTAAARSAPLPRTTRSGSGASGTTAWRRPWGRCDAWRA